MSCHSLWTSIRYLDGGDLLIILKHSSQTWFQALWFCQLKIAPLPKTKSKWMGSRPFTSLKFHTVRPVQENWTGMPSLPHERPVHIAECVFSRSSLRKTCLLTLQISCSSFYNADPGAGIVVKQMKPPVSRANTRSPAWSAQITPLLRWLGRQLQMTHLALHPRAIPRQTCWLHPGPVAGYCGFLKSKSADGRFLSHCCSVSFRVCLLCSISDEQLFFKKKKWS